MTEAPDRDDAGGTNAKNPASVSGCGVRIGELGGSCLSVPAPGNNDDDREVDDETREEDGVCRARAGAYREAVTGRRGAGRRHGAPSLQCRIGPVKLSGLRRWARQRIRPLLVLRLS